MQASFFQPLSTGAVDSITVNIAFLLYWYQRHVHIAVVYLLFCCCWEVEGFLWIKSFIILVLQDARMIITQGRIKIYYVHKYLFIVLYIDVRIVMMYLFTFYAINLLTM